MTNKNLNLALFIICTSFYLFSQGCMKVQNVILPSSSASINQSNVIVSVSPTISSGTNNPTPSTILTPNNGSTTTPTIPSAVSSTPNNNIIIPTPSPTLTPVNSSTPTPSSTSNTSSNGSTELFAHHGGGSSNGNVNVIFNPSPPSSGTP